MLRIVKPTKATRANAKIDPSPTNNNNSHVHFRNPFLDIQDLEIAAELGRTLLERNSELEKDVKEQQAVIEDQTEHIQFLTKQNNTMKEEASSRSKFYEQLESTIFELERTNNQLSRKHQVDRKRIQSLCENIDYLEKKCEEMTGTLEQLENIRDDHSRKHYANGKMSKSSFFNYGSDSLSSEDSVDFGFRTRSHSLSDLRVRSPDEFDSGNSSNSPSDLKTSESEFIFALESRIEQLLTTKKQEMEKIHQMETQLRMLIQENANLQEQLNLVQTEKDEQILELRKQLLDTSNYAQQTLTLSVAAHLNSSNLMNSNTNNNNNNNNSSHSCSHTSQSSSQEPLYGDRKSLQSTIDILSSSSQLLQSHLSSNTNNVSSEITPLTLNNLLGTNVINPSSSSNLVNTQNIVENISDQLNNRSNLSTSTNLILPTSVVGPNSLLCNRCSAEINLLNLVNAIENDDEETQDYNSLEFELARANQSMRHSLNLYENPKSRDNDKQSTDNQNWHDPWGANKPSLVSDILPFALEEEIGEEACEIPVDFVSSSSRSSKVLDDLDDDEDPCLKKDRDREKSKNKSSSQVFLPKFKLVKLEIPKKIPCDVDDDDDDDYISGNSSSLHRKTETIEQDLNCGDDVCNSSKRKLETLGKETETSKDELKKKKATEEKKKKGVVFYPETIPEEPICSNLPKVSVFLTPAPVSTSFTTVSPSSSLDKLNFQESQPEYRIILDKLKNLFALNTERTNLFLNSKHTYPVYPLLHQHGP